MRNMISRRFYSSDSVFMNLRPSSFIIAALMLSTSCATIAQNPPELPSGWTPKQIVFTNKDMVVAANPLAVDAGIEMLRAGGAAIDAAIAVQMVLNLVEPQSSGIGGGAFMLHYDGVNKKLETYDGRETAPAAATGNLFLSASGTPLSFATRVGGRSVGTPGVLRMLELAHKEKGKLAWAKLFEPAIRLSEQGFPLSGRLFSATSGDAAQSSEPRLNAQPLQASAYFYNADCFFWLQRWDDAANAYQNFYLSFPKHERVPNAMFQKAVCLFRKGSYDESVTDFKAFLHRFPDHPLA